MESLNDIGMAEDTDKAGLTARGGHHYTDLYELLFREHRESITSILEIGVLDGGSIRMWRRYFPKSHVVAIDKEDQITFQDDPNVEFIHGDAYSEEVISDLSGRTFDLMIDDADHRVETQIIFLERYSPMLNPGGIMIVEDVIMKDGALILKQKLPAGFSCAIVQMTEGNSILDSRLVIAYRK